MTIAFYQGSGYLGKVDKNLELIGQTLRKAKDAKADVAVFPELFTTGYDLSKDAFEQIVLAYDFKAILSQMAKQHQIALIIGFAHCDETGRLFNGVGCFDEAGVCLHIHKKAILWGAEREIFSAGEAFESFVFKGIRVGMMICFETEFIEPCQRLANQGTKIIFSVVANADDGYNQNMIGALVPTRAMENRIFLLYCNRSGVENDLTYLGKSTLSNPYGQIIAQCNATESTLKFASINLDEVEQARDYFSYDKIINALDIKG